MSDVVINEEVSLHTLSSGLRVAHRRCDSPVEYCGVVVNVGSRDETSDCYGLAHFVEHTIFKGTARRRSWHIINRMEAVGGELNAYTTKEETTLYSVFPYGNLNRAVELIADLVTNSQFPANEIDREREVVAEEINSYLDTPSEAVYDDFEDLMFKGSSLGHNILGSLESISSFTPEVCRRYLAENYTAGNMVFFYMGSSSPERVFRCVESHFTSLDRSMKFRNRVEPVVVAPFDVRRDIDSHQAHTVTGARLPGMYSPMRYSISLFSNILGGPGMNSLLNIALRERRGLVYTVEASTTMFTDVGALMIYFGCDPDDLKKCRRWVKRTIDDLAEKPLSVRAIDAAKKQYLGQLAVASENREQMALATGRSVLYHGRVPLAHETRQNILDVTQEDLMQVAQMVASDKYSILTLG